MSCITLNVNGIRHAVDVEPATRLLCILRNDLNMQGPRFGCGLGRTGLTYAADTGPIEEFLREQFGSALHLV
jgi:aerobic-type carbon monoxide dehydrogenase small subunit (CoxS/CutS family)